MKKLFYLLLIIPFSISAQFAVADYIVLNEGMDNQYNDLEKVWKVYHQQSIDAGEKQDGQYGRQLPIIAQTKMQLIMLCLINFLLKNKWKNGPKTLIIIKLF